MEDNLITTTESTVTSTSEDVKCEDMPSAMEYKPFGGATSFDEIDANKAIGEYAMNVEMETASLRGIINNILDEDEDEMPVDQKIAAMQKAASDYQSRVNALKVQASGKENDKGLLRRIKDILDGGEKRTFTAEQRRAMAKSGQALPDGSFPIALPDNHGFKVYRDTEGDLRWLSLSSNAFEDLDKELFTTKALEEAIEYADKTEERGPLLVFHVPSAEIGQCDYQGMAGRFLVESGTFDDTPLGRKAVEYFVNSDEEHQVSIGYQYLSGDEEDGQYDWLRIKERSVCPYGTAANPWTDFKVIGENPMEQRKVEALEKIFGKDLSAQVIANAEAKTKELEDSIRFKETKTEEKTEVEDKAEPEVVAVTEAKPETPVVEEKTEVEAEAGKEAESEETVINAGQLAQLVSVFTDINTKLEELSGVKDQLQGLEDQVKELKKSEDERISELMSPRWSFPGGIRPTESNRNTVDEEKEIDGVSVKELIGEQEAAPNPAQAYVNDLLGIQDRMAIG